MILAAVFAVRLMLGGHIEPKPIAADAWIHVSQTSLSRSWFSFALDAPNGYVWERKQKVVIELKDGSTEIAWEAYAITPQAERVKLGERSVCLLYDQIERRNYRHEGVMSMVWAAFRPGIPADSIRAVTLVRGI